MGLAEVGQDTPGVMFPVSSPLRKSPANSARRHDLPSQMPGLPRELAVMAGSTSCSHAGATFTRTIASAMPTSHTGMASQNCSTVKEALFAVPPLGSSASPGRAWRLQAARHSQTEADPLGAQPLPRVLELAASKAAHFPAFDHAGARSIPWSCMPHRARTPDQQRTPD